MLIAGREDEYTHDEERGPQEKAQTPREPVLEITLREETGDDPGKSSQGEHDGQDCANEHPAWITAALCLLVLLSTIGHTLPLQTLPDHTTGTVCASAQTYPQVLPPTAVSSPESQNTRLICTKRPIRAVSPTIHRMFSRSRSISIAVIFPLLTLVNRASGRCGCRLPFTRASPSLRSCRSMSTDRQDVWPRYTIGLD